MNGQLGPLNGVPLGVREPYTQRDPQLAQQAGESDEQWRTRMHADRLAALLDPLEGIELGRYDRRQLDWLAGWDIPTVATLASLLHRARSAKPLAHGGTA